MRLRKARQQTANSDRDGGAAEDVADAVMRARAKGENSLRLAMNIKARRVRKHVGIIVRRKRRRPYHHALQYGRASNLTVASGNALDALPEIFVAFAPPRPAGDFNAWRGPPQAHGMAGHCQGLSSNRPR